MNSPLKVFLSLLVLIFISGGVYFGAIKALNSYKKMEKSLLEKKISVKPKNIKEKQALVDPWSIDKDEYTFFDTLDDPSMSKFIGLNKNSIEPQEATNDSSNFNSEVKKKSIFHSDNVIATKAMNSVAHKTETLKRDSSFVSGYVLQVGSFNSLERANLFKNNLDKKGYPTFVVAAQILEGGEIWHRVVIGGFAEKEFAFKAKIKIKEKENINSVIKWHDGPKQKFSQ